MNWTKAVKRVRIPLGILAAALFLAFARPTWTSLLTGLPLVVLGLGVRGYASGYLSKNKELATTGLYARTRNPLYLGSALLGAGFAVAGARWEVALVLALLFVAVYAPTILNEERYLRGRFPSFEAYAREVPRFVPRLTPARVGDGAGGFSRALYLKHKEYNAPLGAAAMYGVLIARLLLRG